MSLRTVLIVALALTFGGSAAVGIHTLRKQNGSTTTGDTVSVLVAAADIQRGVTLNEELVKTRAYAKDLVPPGVLTDIDLAKDRAVLQSFNKGEPIADEKLAPKEAGRGIAALIPRGMRAYTIQTPTVSAGVAGFILPGNKVDVLLTVGQVVNDPVWGGSTTTLLQNVEVLAVDQRVDPKGETNRVDTKDLKSATLLVTPDQAAKLTLGQIKGTLHLTLRHPDDHRAANTRPATLADLRFHQEKPWDERLKGALEGALKKWAEERKAALEAARKAEAAKKTEVAKKTEAAAKAVPENPPELKIRTLRGTQDGTVIIQPSGQ